MAKKKAAKKAGKAGGRRGAKAASTGDFIISKSRTKAAASVNVAGDFYAALDAAVRNMIATAEQRATANGRKTLRPQDL
jgi:histone H3/H4